MKLKNMLRIKQAEFSENLKNMDSQHFFILVKKKFVIMATIIVHVSLPKIQTKSFV